MLASVFITVGGVAAQAEPAPPSEAWRGMQHVVSQPSVWTAATKTGAWVYGDSILVGARVDLARRHYARTGQHVAIDANSAIPTKGAVDRLAERVKERGAPRVLVMATGANDAIRDPFELRTQALRVRSVVGPNTKIVWVDVYVNRAGKTVADRASTVNGNRELANVARAGRIDQIVPWSKTVNDRGSAVMTRDGVHPQGVGVAVWSDLISAAIK